MNFNSFDFAVFLALTWVGSRVLRRWQTPWTSWLLVSSAFFYGFWKPWYLLLVAFSIVLQYVVGKRLVALESPGARKAWMIAGVSGDLALLVVFKYGNFLLGTVSDVLSVEVPTLPTELPVGISFYTFQSLSYTIDLYRRKIEPAKSLLDFATYVLFFPQLVAGPIVRAADFLPQLATVPRVELRAMGGGVFLILCGLFKKMVLADTIATFVVNPYFASPAGHSAWETLLAIWAANFQVYCDFSGYSDVAVGAAGLFGYWLPVNFDRPFASLTPMEHWRRWHITLSTWLRDYLYIPLGGSQVSPLRNDFNLVVTFLLGGLWHGAGWTFAVWGLYNGVLLVVWRRWGRPLARLPAPAQAFLTFNAICFGLVFLHAHSFADAGEILRSLTRLSLADTGVFTLPGAVAFAAAVALHATPRSWKHTLREGFAEAPACGVGAAVVLGGSLLSLFASMASPFFYFQF